MDWTALGLSLLILAGAGMQVRHWLAEAERRGFLRGWDACAASLGNRAAYGRVCADDTSAETNEVQA